MHFFRNPEIKRSILLYAVSICFFSAAAFFVAGASYACFLFLAGLFFFLLHLLTTYFRYRRIRLLCQEIDQSLHGAGAIHFSDYSEGELAVLKIQIDKMFTRLLEQSDALSEDKRKLAASMADISHQIRTPLTSIRLVLSLLSEPDIPRDQIRPLIQQLSLLISRIDWLIEALLKLSRLDAGTVVLKPENIPVAKLVSAAAQPLEIAMELREQHFSFHANTCREAVLGDFAWTTEALGNILKNCMEHTPPGGSILVSARENAIYTEIVIEDDGPGFDAQDLPRLFERFYKGKTSADTSVGIGLALSRTILARQNATIKAENRPKGGARFILHFYKNQI